MKDKKRDNLIIRLVTVLLTCLVMLIDWSRTATAGDVWTWTSNALGLLAAVWMIAILGIRGFWHVSSLIWLLVGIIAIPLIGWHYWKPETYLYAREAVSAAAGVWGIGFSYIRLFREVVMQKKRKLHFNASLGILLTLLFCVLISKNEDVWPLFYALIFTPAYLVGIPEEKQRAITKGMTDALILTFFLFQGYAFVFRPFDDFQARYRGIYTNQNMTALFYLLVYPALLTRAMECRRWWSKVFFYGLAASVWGFVFLTGSRTGLIVLFVLSMLFIIFGCLWLKRRKALPVMGWAAAFCVVIAISIPVDYAAVRYLPPLFHHPVWFDGEYSEGKVHSWDPWDSEKYVSFERVTGTLLDRIGSFFERFGIPSKVHASDGSEVLEAPEDSMLIRKIIWSYYLKGGSLLGHSNEEGHQIPGRYWDDYNWHAQNYFLQYWYYYGIPAAVLLLAHLIWSTARALAGILKDEDRKLFPFLCLIIFEVFGLLEVTWNHGQAIFFLLFFLPVLLQKAGGERERSIMEGESCK